MVMLSVRLLPHMGVGHYSEFKESITSRVFRKRVKAKDFNGHPPEPSGQSYY